MTSRPFHYLLVVAVALWAHVCCCTGGPVLAGPQDVPAVKLASTEKACCKRHGPATPAKSPCKPSSCGRCVEKNLSTSGASAVHLSGCTLAAFDVPTSAPLPRLAQAWVATPTSPAAYPPTSLLRLHCALIV